MSLVGHISLWGITEQTHKSEGAPQTPGKQGLELRLSPGLMGGGWMRGLGRGGGRAGGVIDWAQSAGIREMRADRVTQQGAQSCPRGAVLGKASPG